jgi:hypothetical protein
MFRVARLDSDIDAALMREKPSLTIAAPGAIDALGGERAVTACHAVRRQSTLTE